MGVVVAVVVGEGDGDGVWVALVVSDGVAVGVVLGTRDA